MSDSKVFKLRKYSSLTAGVWDHFPSRNDISLVVLGGDVFKVIWRATVLVWSYTSYFVEFSLAEVDGLSVFHRDTSMGFSYMSLGNGLSEHVKFQIKFISASEFQSCCNYLKTLPISLVDTQVSQSVFPSDGAFLFSQKSQLHDLNNFQGTYAANLEPRGNELESLDFANLLPPVSLSPISFPCDPLKDEGMYQALSQILNYDSPGKKFSKSTSQSNCNEMTDEELQKCIVEKIKDENFMKSVERVELILKRLQETT